MSSELQKAQNKKAHIRGVTALLVSTFFLGLSHGIGYPLTALTFERWGASAFMTGLAAGMPALAALIFLPVAPRFASKYGLIPSMVSGAFIGMLGFLIMPFWASVKGWMILRFLMGLGLLFPWLLGETWINTVCSDKIRGRILSLYVIAMFGGYGAGPILLVFLPVTGIISFITGAASLLFCAAPLILARRMAPKMGKHADANVLPMLRLAPAAMTAALLAGVLEYAYISLLPTFGTRSGLSEASSLRLVTAFLWGGVLLAPVFGYAADRINRSTLLLGLIFGFIVLAPPAALLVSNTAFALPATFILGGFGCAYYTLGLAMLGEQISLDTLAAANAAFLFLYQLGTLAGPPLTGVAMDTLPPLGFLYAALAFAVIAVLWLLFFGIKAETRRITKKLKH
ncbi:MAG: MFS transporter [Desulfobacterales bacterium]|nr:MFS transporter [Desulfobacterales bacterium]